MADLAEQTACLQKVAPPLELDVYGAASPDSVGNTTSQSRAMLTTVQPRRGDIVNTCG